MRAPLASAARSGLASIRRGMTRPTLDEMYHDSMKARPTRQPPSARARLRLDWFVSADNAHALQPRALVPQSNAMRIV